MTQGLPLPIQTTSTPEASKGKETAEASLTNVLTQFENWRANKTRPSEAIPQELWLKIFSLEPFYAPAMLRRFFNLSTRQYQTKQAELLEQAPKIALETKVETRTAKVIPMDPLFEIKMKPESPYAYDSLPSGKTLVVEFCRSDGKIMKIHTTQDSISVLMETFFGGA